MHFHAPANLVGPKTLVTPETAYAFRDAKVVSIANAVFPVDDNDMVITCFLLPFKELNVGCW